MTFDGTWSHPSSVLVTFLLTEKAGVMCEDRISLHGATSHEPYARESV